MALWVSGLLLLGVVTDSEWLACTPEGPGPRLSARQVRRLLLGEPLLSNNVNVEDPDLDLPLDEGESWSPGFPLPSSGRPRPDDRGPFSNLVLPPLPVRLLRLPAIQPRLAGISLKYVVCSLLI